MDEIAYDVVMDGPNPEGKHWRLVVASSSGGYSKLKETGDAADPLYVAKSAIWFDTREEGKAVADQRNVSELNLDPKDAARIVMQAIFPGARHVARGSIGTRFSDHIETLLDEIKDAS